MGIHGSHEPGRLSGSTLAKRRSLHCNVIQRTSEEGTGKPEFHQRRSFANIGEPSIRRVGSSFPPVI